MNVKVIHFSTDYVFDGKSKKPYKESDKPDPHTVYRRTKLEGGKSFILAYRALFYISN
jgi:dTDP-4-dehydrorhamnose reductase